MNDQASPSTGSRSWYPALFLLLLMVAVGLRLWQLDLRPYHYDESLHAYYGWKLATGQGYQHDPMMHGPLQFEATGFAFKLLGDSDYTGRLPAAVLGSLLIALPYFLRRELGRWGALAAAALLAFSPVPLYLGRFARPDIYLSFWILLLVVAVAGYVREQRARYLYLAAASLGLAFATMEAAYLLVAIFLVFLFLAGLRELARAVWGGFRFASLSPIPAMFLFILSLTLPLFIPGVGLFQGLLGVTLANANKSAGLEGAPLGVGIFVAGVLLTLAVVGALWLGMRWRPWRWLAGFGIMYGIYITLYTTFFANPAGLATGVWGSVSYWLVQHGKRRIEQPLFYYPFLLTTYEFLVVLLALGAAVYYVRRRPRDEGPFPMTAFLFFWAAGAFFIFSYAGEKTPWLLIHLVLPLALLAGRFVGEWARWRPLPRAVALAALAALAVVSLRVSLQASFATADRPVQALLYAQGSFDLKKLRPEVEGWLQGGGRVWADADLAYPYAWHFRRYPEFRYTSLKDYTPPAGSLVLAQKGQETALLQKLPGYGPGEDYRNLVWFSEGYRRWGARDFRKAEPWRWWLRYFLFRESQDYLSSAGVVLRPPGP